MESSLAIAILGILNVLQLYFWSRSNQILVDKLMSRNYAEYSQVKSTEKPAIIPEVAPKIDVEEQDVLSELNSMLAKS